MWPPKTILHPTDFSENSHHAFELACQLAASSSSKVMVLHAYAPDIAVMADMPVQIEHKEEATLQLRQIKSTQPGVVIERQMISGTAVEVIVNAAQSMKADLIVMGTYGRSGIKRLFLGSVADHVLRRAPCPILVVPPAKPVETKKT
jgi:universal stress protein A